MGREKKLGAIHYLRCSSDDVDSEWAPGHGLVSLYVVY